MTDEVKTDGIERRTILAEIRADESQPSKLVGYAAVFNVVSEDLGYFREKIAPGAFAETLEKDDVRALYNHDANFVLGRNRSGTLKLEEDQKGLRFEITLPDTSYAKDLLEVVKRGDVSQCSFAFRTISDQWDYSDKKTIERTLLNVQLFDVSPVTYPAYPATNVSARAIEEAKKHQRAEPGGKDVQTVDRERMKMRIKIAEAE